MVYRKYYKKVQYVGKAFALQRVESKCEAANTVKEVPEVVLRNYWLVFFGKVQHIQAWRAVYGQRLEHAAMQLCK